MSTDLILTYNQPVEVLFWKCESFSCSWRPSLSSQEPAATLKRTSDRTCSTWNTSTKTGPHPTPTSSLPRATKTTYSPHSRSGSSPLVYVGWMHVLHVYKAQTDWCSEAYRHEARIIVFSSPFYNFCFIPAPLSRSWTTWNLRHMKSLKRILSNILSTNR